MTTLYGHIVYDETEPPIESEPDDEIVDIAISGSDTLVNTIKGAAITAAGVTGTFTKTIVGTVGAVPFCLFNISKKIEDGQDVYTATWTSVVSSGVGVGVTVVASFYAAPTIAGSIIVGLLGGAIAYGTDKFLDYYNSGGLSEDLNNFINTINSTFFTVHENSVVDIEASTTSVLKEDLKELLNAVDLKYGNISVSTDFTSASEVESFANELKSYSPTRLEVLSTVSNYIEQLKYDMYSDVIYNGTSGDDTLIGNKENGTYNGGDGNDTYETGGGIDVINDTDGQGSISFGGKILTGGSKLASEEYFKKGSIRYKMDGADYSYKQAA